MGDQNSRVSAALRTMLVDHVERGTVPGAAVAVQYGDETHLDAVGAPGYETAEPLRTDAIFRITSLTKPITAVATLILVEECGLRLHDPVDEFLPELADRRVLVRPDAPLDRTAPAHRPITTHDLLTCRPGFGTLWGSSEDFPILAEIERRGLAGFVPSPTVVPRPPDTWLAELAELPLVAQPGERWLYDTSFYVLGSLIARVSGMSYEQFVSDRILSPLGMTDTALTVPESKRHRLVSAYLSDGQSGFPFEDPAAPPLLPNAGAGLVSTVPDYLAFARMLRNNGSYQGVRVLSRPSVQLMITNQLSERQRSDGAPILDPDRGWGLGLSVIRERDRIDAVPGRYGWEGGSGVSWANDPSEDLTGIIFTQRMFAEDSMGVYADFWTSVYSALG